MKNSKIKRYWKIFFNWLKKYYDLLIILGLYLIIYSIGLNNFPKVMTDEPWIGDAAKILFNQNDQTLGLFGGQIDSALFLPYVTAIGLIFKIFGIGIIQGRMLTVIGGAFLIIFLYLIAREIYNRRIAYLSIIFLALNPLLMINRLIRPDIFASLMILISLYLYLRGRKLDKSLLFFFSGLILIIGIGIHPHAGFISPALLVLFLSDYGIKFYKEKNFKYFILGVASFLILLLFYFLINPDIFDFNRSELYSLRLKIIFSWANIKDNFFNEIKRWRNFGLKYSMVYFSWLMGLGFVVISFRRHKIILISIFFILLGLCLINVNKWGSYLIITLPFLSLALAVFADQVIDWVKLEIKKNQFSKKISQGLYYLFTSIILIIFIYLSSNNFWIAQTLARKNTDYYQLISKMKKVIEEKDNILGSTLYWYGFNNQKYLSSHFICRFPERDDLKEKYGKSWSEIIDRQKIDILIWDDNFDDKMDKYFSEDKYLSREKFEKFIKNRCKRLLIIKDPTYTQKNKSIIIYRIIR